MTKETEIEKLILEYLRNLPRCKAYKTPNLGGRGGGRRTKAREKGYSDIVCSYYGYYISIEVKTETGKQSEDQKNFEKDINSVTDASLSVLALGGI